MEIKLTENDRAYLLNNARESIASKLRNRKADYGAPPENTNALYGAFVSLHIDGKLRGCIGTMTGTKAVNEIVRDMARSCAFHDPRFKPLSNGELAKAEIEISVLSPMVKISDISEIHVGVHGLYISAGYKSGVLLPQVAEQEGWDRDSFLAYTCRKAGLSQDAWKNADVDIFTFTALVFSE